MIRNLCGVDHKSPASGYTYWQRTRYSISYPLSLISRISPEEKGDRHGLGLHIMQERVEELCGSFDLKTAPGQGTCISVDVRRENADD